MSLQWQIGEKKRPSHRWYLWQLYLAVINVFRYRMPIYKIIFHGPFYLFGAVGRYLSWRAACSGRERARLHPHRSDSCCQLFPLLYPLVYSSIYLPIAYYTYMYLIHFYTLLINLLHCYTRLSIWIAQRFNIVKWCLNCGLHELSAL